MVHWTGAYINHKFELKMKNKFEMPKMSLQKWNRLNQEFTCFNQGFIKMKAMVQLG